MIDNSNFAVYERIASYFVVITLTISVAAENFVKYSLLY
jgi:hypothetical protein